MKKRILSLLTLALLTLTLAAPVMADVIIDTGTPTDRYGSYLEYIITTDEHNVEHLTCQNFAGQFTLTKGYTVTAVRGFFNNDGTGSVDAVIYGDNGNTNTPLTTSELWRKNITTATPTAAWRGLTELNWSLQAGTYWLAFEPKLGFHGQMIDAAPKAMDSIAQGNIYRQGDPFTYTSSSGNFGFQIDGTAANAVPEPSTYLLLCISLGAVGFVRKRMVKSNLQLSSPMSPLVSRRLG